MKPATRIGLVVLLAGAIVATVTWFLRPAPRVRYAGEAAGVAALVSLKLPDGARAPDRLTIELGDGERLVAQRLP